MFSFFTACSFSPTVIRFFPKNSANAPNNLFALQFTGQRSSVSSTSREDRRAPCSISGQELWGVCPLCTPFLLLPLLLLFRSCNFAAHTHTHRVCVCCLLRSLAKAWRRDCRVRLCDVAYIVVWCQCNCYRRPECPSPPQFRPVNCTRDRFGSRLPLSW